MDVEESVKDAYIRDGGLYHAMLSGEAWKTLEKTFINPEYETALAGLLVQENSTSRGILVFIKKLRDHIDQTITTGDMYRKERRS
jgi:hypothetical protein